MKEAATKKTIRSPLFSFSSTDGWYIVSISVFDHAPLSWRLWWCEWYRSCRRLVFFSLNRAYKWDDATRSIFICNYIYALLLLFREGKMLRIASVLLLLFFLPYLSWKHACLLVFSVQIVFIHWNHLWWSAGERRWWWRRWSSSSSS